MFSTVYRADSSKFADRHHLLALTCNGIAFSLTAR
jgi:hypothetical protein